MKLSEYLAQPEIATLTVPEMVASANAYESVEYVNIEGSVRKTAVETTNLIHGTVDRLSTYTPPNELDEIYHAAAIDIARKIIQAFNNLYKPEFYINLQDPEVKSMFDYSVPFGILTQSEYDRITAAGTRITKPFESVVEQDIIEIQTLGETIGSIFYDSIDSIGIPQQFNVRTNSTNTRIEIALDDGAVEYDTTFTIYISKKSGISGEWIENPKAIITNEVLSKGSKETIIDLTRYYDRYTKYRVVSNRVDNFTTLVTSVSKY